MTSAFNNQNPSFITTEKQLRGIIPSYPKMLDKRIQAVLDEFSLEFIHVAKVAILATNDKLTSMHPIDIQEELEIVHKNQLLIHKYQACFQPDNHHTALNASLYFMVPGLGHGLRINGTLEHRETALCFNIKEVYFHCARAAARADIWSTLTSTDISEDSFIQRSPFLLLKTMNKAAKTEISPRGDQAGFVKKLTDTTLLIPERPGNKIAISLRNILSFPEIEILLLVPGSYKTLSIKGSASVLSDQTILSTCAVNGKTPKTGILLEIASSSFQEEPSLVSSGLWDTKHAVDKTSITSFSKALSAHINGTGLIGKATNAIVDVVVKHDMKHLY